jgi:short-subunit dehydrogenase involved in D-alanine esterification of teichoic acids
VRIEQLSGKNTRSEFSIYKLEDVYTKLIVVVNAAGIVDKNDFFHKISGLRRRKLAEQGLYPG